MTLLNHLPALQVLIPFFGALLAILASQRLAYYIALTCALSTFALSYFALSQGDMAYAFGNWQPPFGIEYRLDSLNKPVIFYIASCLTFLLLFNRQLISSTVLDFIPPKRQQLFFAILLFAHAGFIGVVSTYDIFNLYVFIEISSLSAYVLMSCSNSPRSAVGAFDYLILGTIGATLILLGIAFLLAITGSLNMGDIKLLSSGSQALKTMHAATSFIVIGCLLKLAFFPLHFWMIRAYNSASIAVLIYLAAISGIIGVYMLMRLSHFVLEWEQIRDGVSRLLYPLSLIAILLGASLALYAQKPREIVIYSATSNIGYAILLFTRDGNWDLMLKYLIFDGVNKVAIFLIIGLDESQKKNCLSNRVLAAINIIYSAGLPLSGIFFVKLGILELFISRALWLDFITILIASSLALLYHYRIVKQVFFDMRHSGASLNDIEGSLTIITLIQLTLPWFLL